MGSMAQTGLLLVPSDALGHTWALPGVLGAGQGLPPPTGPENLKRIAHRAQPEPFEPFRAFKRGEAGGRAGERAGGRAAESEALSGPSEELSPPVGKF